MAYFLKRRIPEQHNGEGTDRALFLFLVLVLIALFGIDEFLMCISVRALVDQSVALDDSGRLLLCLQPVQLFSSCSVALLWVLY